MIQGNLMRPCPFCHAQMTFKEESGCFVPVHPDVMLDNGYHCVLSNFVSAY